MTATPKPRRVERVRLSLPIPATAATVRAFVLDVSLRGFLIAHKEPLSETKACRLSFEWHGRPIAVDCRVVHSGKTSGDLYHTGLEMLHEAPAGLRALIESHRV
ncbi:MAG TPA: PilZ domain-containing protein [Thermoanaerobaculia bacterium]|nr:PilZ domain-containing protein [Thermoanaerobaculia bacterium]